jgi:hypothetical protein
MYAIKSHLRCRMSLVVIRQEENVRGFLDVQSRQKKRSRRCWLLTLLMRFRFICCCLGYRLLSIFFKKLNLCDKRLGTARFGSKSLFRRTFDWITSRILISTIDNIYWFRFWPEPCTSIWLEGCFHFSCNKF